MSEVGSFGRPMKRHALQKYSGPSFVPQGTGVPWTGKGMPSCEGNGMAHSSWARNALHDGM